MSEAAKRRERAEDQEVDGSGGRPPTEGKWVAEPRDPAATDEADGINRLRAVKSEDSANPENLQPGPDDEAIEEKVVEAGVEESKNTSTREYLLGPRSL